MTEERYKVSIIFHKKPSHNSVQYYDGEEPLFEKDVLKRLNEQDKKIKELERKLECCEYEQFQKEQDKIRQKVKKGDTSDFNTLRMSKEEAEKHTVYYNQYKE